MLNTRTLHTPPDASSPFACCPAALWNTSVQQRFGTKSAGAPCTPRSSPCRRTCAALPRSQHISCKGVCAKTTRAPGTRQTPTPPHRVPFRAAPRKMSAAEDASMKTCAPCTHRQSPRRPLHAALPHSGTLQLQQSFGAKSAGAPCTPRSSPGRRTCAALPRSQHISCKGVRAKTTRAPGTRQAQSRTRGSRPRCAPENGSCRGCRHKKHAHLALAASCLVAIACCPTAPRNFSAAGALLITAQAHLARPRSSPCRQVCATLPRSGHISCKGV